MAINGLNGNYYPGYFPQNCYSQRQVNGYSPYQPNGNLTQYANLPKKSEKTGFWEGVGAFFKGLVKPIVNMVKHPIKTIIGAAIIGAIIIGTGGAATPFLLAGGLMLGGWQAGKGIYNAVTSNSREETLAALEDVGEGTFSIAASAIGARNYAAGLKTAATAGEAASATTTAGEAAAAATKPSIWTRTGTYLKEMYEGSKYVLKNQGKSYSTSWNMLKSGEFTGNLKSAAGAFRIALKQKQVDKLGDIGSYRYDAEKAKLAEMISKHNGNNADRVTLIGRKYFNMYGKLQAKGLGNSDAAKMIEGRLASLTDKGLINPQNMTAIKSAFNPKIHSAEYIASYPSSMLSGDDNPGEQQAMNDIQQMEQQQQLDEQQNEQEIRNKILRELEYRKRMRYGGLNYNV